MLVEQSVLWKGPRVSVTTNPRAAPKGLGNTVRAPTIVFVTTRLGVGGAENQLVRIAQGLRDRGWAVAVVSLTPSEDYVEQLRADGIEVVDLGIRKERPSLIPVLTMRRLIRERRPDVVCAFLFHSTVLAALTAGLRRRPIVVSSLRHENVAGRARDLVTVALDRLGAVELTVANSRRVAASCVEANLMPERRICHVPNGIDVVDGEPVDVAEVRREIGVDPGAFLWLTVGHFRAEKDYPTLLSAFALVLRARPHTRLAIAGGYEPDVRTEELLAQLGAKVVRLGRRKDVPRLMASADGFVLGSCTEGFPNVVMEAMLARRGVVCTDVGGVPELVEAGRTGLLAPPRDPAALAEAMQRFMALDPPERQAMGEAGHAHIVRHYALDAVVDRWEELFLGLIARRQTR